MTDFRELDLNIKTKPMITYEFPVIEEDDIKPFIQHPIYQMFKFKDIQKALDYIQIDQEIILKQEDELGVYLITQDLENFDYYAYILEKEDKIALGMNITQLIAKRGGKNNG